MNPLARMLRGFLERHFREAIGRQSQDGGRHQPVLIGPPDATLEALFTDLTAGGEAEWSLIVDGVEYSVPVLLIQGTPEARRRAVLSARCGWSYAVSLRDSCPYVLVLSSRSAWDDRLVSIANATDTIGVPTIDKNGDFASIQPWPHLVAGVCERLPDIDPGIVPRMMDFVRRDASQLGDAVASETVWVSMGRLLQAEDWPAACWSVGLPYIPTPSESNLTTAERALSGLASYTGNIGFGEAQREFEQAARSLADKGEVGVEVELAVEQMFEHLFRTAESSVAFSESPARVLRPPEPDASWWRSLDYELLHSLLRETGATKDGGTLGLSCLNRLPGLRTPVVVSEVRLRVSGTGLDPSDVSVDRRTRQAYEPLSRDDHQVGEDWVDQDIPEHHRPIAYRATADNHRSARIQVVVLDRFEAHGLLWVQDAIDVGLPRRQEGVLVQTIDVSGVGLYHCDLYVASTVAQVRATTGSGSAEWSHDGSGRVEVDLELDDSEDISILLLDDNGAQVGAWLVRAAISEPLTGLPETRLDALVRANRSGAAGGNSRVPQVQPTSAPFRRVLESQILESPESWRGLVGCWGPSSMRTWVVDWERRALGDIEVSPSPIPQLSRPPDAFLRAREDVRKALLEERQSVAEVDFSADELCQLVERLLQEYLKGLQTCPEEMAWVDSILMYDSTIDSQASLCRAEAEPSAILLSPLHPLRLGWQAVAQSLLAESLENERPCPAAGLLDPFAAPSITAMPVRSGSRVAWPSFAATSSNDPHWSILLHRDRLTGLPVGGNLARAMDDLGLRPSDLPGGISRSHTMRALGEVRKILSARAVLRVGLVGAGDGSEQALEGILGWMRESFDRESGGYWPPRAEVHDLRENPTMPSSAQIQLLLEETDERVSWFGSPDDSSDRPRLDLVLLDEVDTSGLTLIEGGGGGKEEPRSAIARGGVTRMNLRRDYDAAQTVEETRIAAAIATGTPLETVQARCLVATEELATRDRGASVLQFRPNQAAIRVNVKDAYYLAATSSAIDPACFVRGLHDAGGYLWDYELADVAGLEDDRVGYYLIADPPPSILDALSNAVQLVTPSFVDPAKLLHEISMRGIPVLRRFAKGGTSTRGELGLLMAVRMLQDSFRMSEALPRLPVLHDGEINLLVPVDSYWPSLRPFAKASRDVDTDEHADLLAVSVNLGREVRIRVTPLEVKYRKEAMANRDVSAALEQARNLGRLLHEMWEDEERNGLWRACTATLLAQCLDHAFRVGADSKLHRGSERAWYRAHQETVRAVLSEEAQVQVEQAGAVIIFSQGSYTRVARWEDGRATVVTVGPDDMEGLLLATPVPSQSLDEVTKALRLRASQGVSRPQAPDVPGSGGLPDSTDSAGSESERPDAAVEATGAATGEAPENGVGDPESGAQGGDAVDPPGPTDLSGPDLALPEMQHVRASDVGESVTENQAGAGAQESGVGRVTPETRRRVDEAFEGFVGNSQAVGRTKLFLLRGLSEEQPYLAKNLLFTGQPSTGKTEIARRISAALALPFVSLDGTGLRDRSRLFALINGSLQQSGARRRQVGTESGLPVLQYPPLLVFIDEVHLVARPVQESLLKVLEASDRKLTLEDHVAILDRATFLFATTRASALDGAFLSRCTEIQLSEYSVAEVAEILKRGGPQATWPDEVYQKLARLGRQVPRVALSLAVELETRVLVSEDASISILTHLEEMARDHQIDSFGLTPLHRQYLEVLQSQGGAAGERLLQQLLGSADPRRIAEEIEPYLIRLDFVRITGRGRELTDLGNQYLARQ